MSIIIIMLLVLLAIIIFCVIGSNIHKKVEILSKEIKNNDKNIINNNNKKDDTNIVIAAAISAYNMSVSSTKVENEQKNNPNEIKTSEIKTSYTYNEYPNSKKNKEYYDNISNAKVKVVDLTLRDAHQSLIATRMPYSVMEPVLDDMDKLGLHAVECWGGATFDSCIRFLNEDPWDRLRKFKKHFKKTKLQMLFRGQNILGYNHYADDVVEYFVKKSVSNGIDVIRIFDCLNDIRNLKTAVDASKKEGAHVQIAISYTLGEAYTLNYYKKLAKNIEELGADSICIKDMAGLLLPYEAEKLVKAIKSVVKIPLEMHTHYTSGMASMSLIKSIEAGCDIIDTCFSPMALGTSHPATDVMIKALEGTKYDTMIDSSFAVNIATYFEKYKDDCIASGLLNPKVLSVNVNTLKYQVPGGMLSNLLSQLKEQGKLDKLQEVLEEVPRVRKDLGEPPLVTPSSQIVGTQSVLNVLSGERYKVVPKETKKLVKGEFGQTILPMNKDVVKKILGDEERITDRPADHIKPQLKSFKEEMKEYKKQDEDVLTYALFPAVAKKFFENRT